jgi:hypothetical protein
MFTEIQSRKKILLTALLFVVVTICCALLYIHQIQSKFIAHTKLKISEQQTTLSSIALLTAKDGADSTVLKIIKDCSPENRALFDEKLSNLPLLKGQELVVMEQLFNTCGNFFAERKAVMVARLSDEYQVYMDLIEIVATVDKKFDATEYKEQEWGRLVEMETKRSDLSTLLVEVQGDIIRALKDNVIIASDEMQAELVDAQKTKQSLVELTMEIDSLLQEILNL